MEVVTMDKDKYIAENYQTMKVSEIAKALETSEANVKRIARKLGISKFKSVKWTPIEERTLQRYYSYLGAQICADMLDRSKGAVHKKAEQLGLKQQNAYIYHDKQGYVVDTSDRKNKRYIHRKIMEEMIGRPLRSDEIVHHIDGNKKNNDPSNLQIVTRKEHINIHRDDLNRGK
jgi:predicted transcriptional regulator